MALLAIEGFDDGLAAIRHSLADGTISPTYGKNDNGMRVGDTTAGTLKIATSSDLTQTFGFALYITDTDGWYLGGWSNNVDYSLGYQCVLSYDAANERIAVQDRTGNTYGTASTILPDTWYYVELQCLFNNGAGSWECRVDGVLYASASSRDTESGSNPWLHFGGGDTDAIDDWYIDDFYYLDSTGTSNNDFLGICKVETDLPSGNGNSSVLVGSDSNSTDNYLLVDNNASVPPVATEYVESDTEGDKDTYAMSDLTTTGTVHGVQTTLYAQKDDSGAKYVRPVIRSGGTDYPGTSSALSDSTYVVFDEVWDEDPDTSTTWLYGGVNGMEVGPEIRDS